MGSGLGKGSPVNSISGFIEQELTTHFSQVRCVVVTHQEELRTNLAVVLSHVGSENLNVVPNDSQANPVSTRRAVRPCKETPPQTFTEPQQNDASGSELSGQLLQTLSG